MPKYFLLSIVLLSTVTHFLGSDSLDEEKKAARKKSSPIPIPSCNQTQNENQTFIMKTGFSHIHEEEIKKEPKIKKIFSNVEKLNTPEGVKAYLKQVIFPSLIKKSLIFQQEQEKKNKQIENLRQLNNEFTTVYNEKGIGAKGEELKRKIALSIRRLYNPPLELTTIEDLDRDAPKKNLYNFTFLKNISDEMLLRCFADRSDKPFDQAMGFFQLGLTLINQPESKEDYKNIAEALSKLVPTSIIDKRFDQLLSASQTRDELLNIAQELIKLDLKVVVGSSFNEKQLNHAKINLVKAITENAYGIKTHKNLASQCYKAAAEIIHSKLLKGRDPLSNYLETYDLHETSALLYYWAALSIKDPIDQVFLLKIAHSEAEEATRIVSGDIGRQKYRSHINQKKIKDFLAEKLVERDNYMIMNSYYRKLYPLQEERGQDHKSS